MEKLESFISLKKEFSMIYREGLKNIKDIEFQEEIIGAETCWWLTCIKFGREVDLSKLQSQLRLQGIQTRRLFMPVVEFPPYRSFKKVDFPMAYAIYERGLCLPSSTVNSADDIYYVCKTLKELF